MVFENVFEAKFDGGCVTCTDGEVLLDVGPMLGQGAYGSVYEATTRRVAGGDSSDVQQQEEAHEAWVEEVVALKVSNPAIVLRAAPAHVFSSLHANPLVRAGSKTLEGGGGEDSDSQLSPPLPGDFSFDYLTFFRLGNKHFAAVRRSPGGLFQELTLAMCRKLFGATLSDATSRATAASVPLPSAYRAVLERREKVTIADESEKYTHAARAMPAAPRTG